ncbi:MAG: hypothetical protein AB8B63_15305 [Granulosicoccus sp.]
MDGSFRFDVASFVADASSPSGLSLNTILTLALLSCLPVAYSSETVEGNDIESKGKFESLYEPSGITWLRGRDFLVVEDEPHQALTRLTIEEKDAVVVERSFAISSSFIERQAIGQLDDLEAAARGNGNRRYVVGSHSDANRKRFSARQKIISLPIDAHGHGTVRVKLGLAQELRSNYPALRDAMRNAGKDDQQTLNIEALAFDRKRNRLLIGLRSPTIEGDAVIVPLLNPEDYFQGNADPVFADSLWRLNLDNGGMRALTYDDESDTLIAVSRKESGKSRRFKLWLIGADGQKKARRIRSEKKDLFDNVEGVVSIGDSVLFVRDDGQRRKNRGASWFSLHRSQIGVDGR